MMNHLIVSLFNIAVILPLYEQEKMIRIGARTDTIPRV